MRPGGNQNTFKSQTLEQYLLSLKNPEGLSFNGQYTLLSNARNDELEVYRMVQAIGFENTLDALALSPERLALLYTTVIAQTECEILNEHYLESLVNYLFQNHIIHQINQYSSTFKLIDRNINKDIKDFFTRLKNNNITLKNTVDQAFFKYRTLMMPGLKRSNYNSDKEQHIEETLTLILQNSLYKEKVTPIVKDIVTSSIQNVINQKEKLIHNNESYHIKALKKSIGNTRQTYLIVGAPASGKSSMTGLFQKQYNDDFDIKKIVKINTDFYRKIIGNNQTLGNDARFHAEFTHDESALIKTLTVKRTKNFLQDGKSVDSLYDTVNFRPEKVNFGLLNNGRVDVKVATVDPRLSVSRSIERGKIQGRYVPIPYILKTHKELPNQIDNILNIYPNKNITMSVYDSDAPNKDTPTLVEHIDLATKQAIVFKPQILAAIYSNRELNSKANTIVDIFPEGRKNNYSQISSLTSQGYTVMLTPPVFKSNQVSLPSTVFKQAHPDKICVFNHSPMIKNDDLTTKPIFTYQCEGSNDQVLGSISLYGAEKYCVSNDGLKHNIIHSDGVCVFLEEQIKKHTPLFQSQLDNCEVYPPTFWERESLRLKPYALQGISFGISNGLFDITKELSGSSTLALITKHVTFSSALFINQYLVQPQNLDNIQENIILKSMYETLIITATQLGFEGLKYLLASFANNLQGRNNLQLAQGISLMGKAIGYYPLTLGIYRAKSVYNAGSAIFTGSIVSTTAKHLVYNTYRSISSTSKYIRSKCQFFGHEPNKKSESTDNFSPAPQSIREEFNKHLYDFMRLSLTALKLSTLALLIIYLYQLSTLEETVDPNVYNGI